MLIDVCVIKCKILNNRYRENKAGYVKKNKNVRKENINLSARSASELDSISSSKPSRLFVN